MGLTSNVIAAPPAPANQPRRVDRRGARGRRPLPIPRERILESAAELSSEKNFHPVLTAESAAQAGVGNGGISRHFSSKQGLYAAVVEGFSRLDQRIVSDIAQCRGASNQIPLLTRWVLPYFWERQPFFAWRNDPAALSPGQAERDQAEPPRLSRLVSHPLTQGIRAGEIDSRAKVEMAPECLPGMIGGGGRYRPDTSDPRTAANKVADIFFAGCARRATSAQERVALLSTRPIG